MPPQVNAKLTAVKTATAAKGGRDNWDNPTVEPSGSGAVKWSGEAPAYSTDGLSRVQGVNGPSIAIVRVLYVDSSIAVAANIDTDDIIEWTDHNGVARSGEAKIVSVRQLSGIPQELQTTRIELQPG